MRCIGCIIDIERDDIAIAFLDCRDCSVNLPNRLKSVSFVRCHEMIVGVADVAVNINYSSGLLFKLSCGGCTFHMCANMNLRLDDNGVVIDLPSNIFNSTKTFVYRKRNGRS